MNYQDAMAMTGADFLGMIWPVSLLIAAWAIGAYIKWLTPRK